MINDVSNMKSYRLIYLDEVGREAIHHIWVWAVDKDVRNYILALGDDIPSGEVSEAHYLKDGWDKTFVPIFSSN